MVSRTTEVVAAEEALRWSLVAVGMGGRPRIAPSAVTAAMEEAVPVAVEAFTVHRFWLADFLLVFDSLAARGVVANVGEVHGRGVSLRFSPGTGNCRLLSGSIITAFGSTWRGCRRTSGAAARLRLCSARRCGWSGSVH